MSYWDLDKYTGNARTEYILDASCVTSATLASMVTVTGAGAAVLTANLNTPGGRISLNTTNATDAVAVALPPRFGVTGRSVRAWIVEVEGLTKQTNRGLIEVQAYSTAANYNMVRWDATSVSVVSRSANVEKSQVSRADPILNVTDGSVGLMQDYSAASLHGHMGGSMVAVPQALVGGLWQARIFAAGTSAVPATSVSFRQLKLTVIWDTYGGTVTRVY